MSEREGAEPEPLIQRDDLTDNEFAALRERFEQVMRQHPYNLTVLSDDAPKLTVRKMSAFVPVSDQLLHPERYPASKVSRWTRLRWRWHEARDRASLAWEALRKGRSGVHDGCY